MIMPILDFCFSQLGAGILVALKLKQTAVSPQSSQEQCLQTKQKLLSLTPSGKAIGGCNFVSLL